MLSFYSTVSGKCIAGKSAGISKAFEKVHMRVLSLMMDVSLLEQSKHLTFVAITEAAQICHSENK